MKVREIMTREVECTKPTDNLVHVSRRMRDLNVGCMPVCEQNERLVGVVTDRDIIIRGVAAGLIPEETLVPEVMTQDINYCFENDNVESAANLMEDRQIRRLAVINSEHRLVGIVSLGDIAVRVKQTVLSGQALEQISDPLGGFE